MNSATCTTEDEAVDWVKGHKKIIKKKFASIDLFPPVANPFSIFMAGAPGVGKTEFSKSFVEVYHGVDENNKIVRVDTDEIREIIPGYNGSNASLFQRAAALGIEYIIDSVQDKSQNILVDTTFCVREKAISNIKRALKRERNTGIFYLFQNPTVSWEFTKKREELERRAVPKSFFVEALFAAKDNVNNVKAVFGKMVNLSVVILDEHHNITLFKINIDNVDPYIKIPYTKEKLLKKLR